MIISALDDKALLESVRVLRDGGIIVFPTETVYGVGALPFNKEAIERIYSVKNRNHSKALLLHISKVESLKLARDIPIEAFRLIDKFWPGPLSLILKASKEISENLVGYGNTIGFRMPDDPFFRKLADMVGPIAATSANKSGNPSPVSVESAYEQLGNAVDLYVDGGKIRIGVASTILDLTRNQPTVLRVGAISISEIERVIGRVSLRT